MEPSNECVGIPSRIQIEVALSKILVLMFPVGEKPQKRYIEDNLQAMQDSVGGFIEYVFLEEGIGLVCNEEGKLQNLPPNRHIEEIDDVIRGPFLISRHDAAGEATDLTDADIAKYSRRFC